MQDDYKYILGVGVTVVSETNCYGHDLTLKLKHCPSIQQKGRPDVTARLTTLSHCDMKTKYNIFPVQFTHKVNKFYLE